MSRAPRSGTVCALGMLALVAAGCRGAERRSSAPGDRRADSTVAAAAPARCPPDAGLDSSVSDHGAAAAVGGAISVEAGDSYFAPTCETEVSAGTATLVVRNTGQLLHNVSVPEQGIDQDVAHGEVATVKVRMGGAPLRFRCKYHWAAGMVGALLPK